MYEAPKKKKVSVNFSCTLFYLLDFLTVEDGTNRLSRTVGKELPPYAAYHSRADISHYDLAMQATVWHLICEFMTNSHS
jgi:hypothetical protein